MGDAQRRSQQMEGTSYPIPDPSHRQNPYGPYQMHDPSDRQNCSDHTDAQRRAQHMQGTSYPIPDPSHRQNPYGSYPMHDASDSQGTLPGQLVPSSKPADAPVDREESGLIQDKQVRKAAHKLFNFFDSDGSGQVKADEGQARVDDVTKHTKGKVRVPTAAGDQVIKVLDEDGSGQVDENEMYQGLKKVANVVNAIAKVAGKTS